MSEQLKETVFLPQQREQQPELSVVEPLPETEENIAMSPTYLVELFDTSLEFDEQTEQQMIQNILNACKKSDSLSAQLVFKLTAYEIIDRLNGSRVAAKEMARLALKSEDVSEQADETPQEKAERLAAEEKAKAQAEADKAFKKAFSQAVSHIWKAYDAEFNSVSRSEKIEKIEHLYDLTDDEAIVSGTVLNFYVAVSAQHRKTNVPEKARNETERAQIAERDLCYYDAERLARYFSINRWLALQDRSQTI